MDINNNFYNLTLCKKIFMSPKHLNKNLNIKIMEKLRKKYESKCTTEGFIRDKSIEILKRSIGSITGSNFRGYVTFDIVFTADVCNPMNGEVIIGNVVNINKLGLLAEKGPLSIIIPKDYHESRIIFKDIQIGDQIEVEIIGKRFEINDTRISVIARLTKGVLKKKITITKIKRNIKNITNIDEPTDDIEMESDAERDEELLTDDLEMTNTKMTNEFEELGEEDEYLSENDEFDYDSEADV